MCLDAVGRLPTKQYLRLDIKPAPTTPLPCSAFCFGPETLALVMANLPLTKSFLIATLGLRPEAMQRHFQEIEQGRQVCVRERGSKE